MSIENSLYAAPTGLDSLGENESPLEIEVVDPESVTITAGDMEITIVPDGEGEDFGMNLAEEMDEGELSKIATDLIEEIDADITSRRDWVEMYVKGLEVLGMKYEERTEPWSGACGVYSTVLTEAAIRFQSETITETFPAQGPVKTKIVGAINKMTEEIAERVREDMNYKLTDEMPEYRPEHERMLYSLGLAGSAFKKVYFDPGLGRQVAMFIPAEDLIIPYGASNVMTSERVTHTMRKTKNEIRKLQVSGFYLDVDLGEPVSIHSDIEKKKAEDQGFSLTDDDRYQLLEVHVDYDLPGYEDPDGIALPYVITIDRASTKVLAIRRNWKQGSDLRTKRNHFAQYTYIPGFGVYGLGLIHIIGGYARAGTSLIRQLVDAGTLSNLPGGLKARGLRIKGDDTPIAPGEFRDVDVASGTVRDNIMPLPYKEPSQVLMALLNQITEEARRLGSVADMKFSDMSANAPVGTTLAILERQLKTMSAVQARVHFSMKEEFKLLKDIIRDNAPESYDYDPIGGDRKLKQSDYDVVNVIPVSDPNSATMAQRIMQYQAVIQLSQTAPQIYDLPQLHRQMIEVLGIKNADKLIPLDEDQKPKDPVFENMAIINMKPVKAFQYQDHQAHIQVHMSAMQDPVIMKMVGQNPQAQAMQAAMMAHIAEHTAFAYRQRIEQQLGIALPPEGEDLPPEVELALSNMMAQAAQQVLQENQAQELQEQAQQQAQDPVLQMQQQDLQIKQGELALKEKKLQIDASTKADELELKRQALESKMQLDGFRAGQQAQQAEKKLQADQEREGVRMGIEIAKSRTEVAKRGE
jgi:chaperonin GroES